MIARTIKGKGVSFMENHYYWHTRLIKPEEFEIAMADLGEPAGEPAPMRAFEPASMPAADGAPR